MKYSVQLEGNGVAVDLSRDKDMVTMTCFHGEGAATEMAYERKYDLWDGKARSELCKLIGIECQAMYGEGAGVPNMTYLLLTLRE